jgi:hypothetical protein
VTIGNNDWTDVGYLDEELRWGGPLPDANAEIASVAKSWQEMVEEYDERVAGELRRADGYSEAQVSNICSCCVTDGYPDEFCLLHGRTRYDGQWLGAKMVVINDWLPAGVMFATEREIICSTGTWEQIYQALERRNWIKARLHDILADQMGDILSWLRKAGRDV